jgi:hypothetical protein
MLFLLSLSSLFICCKFYYLSKPYHRTASTNVVSKKMRPNSWGTRYRCVKQLRAISQNMLTIGPCSVLGSCCELFA